MDTLYQASGYIKKVSKRERVGYLFVVGVVIVVLFDAETSRYDTIRRRRRPNFQIHLNSVKPPVLPILLVWRGPPFFGGRRGFSGRRLSSNGARGESDHREN